MMGDMADEMLARWGWEDDGQYDPEPVTCMFCGKKDLEWELVDYAWKLFKGDVQHTCKNQMTMKRHAKDQRKVERWLGRKPTFLQKLLEKLKK